MPTNGMQYVRAISNFFLRNLNSCHSEEKKEKQALLANSKKNTRTFVKRTGARVEFYFDQNLCATGITLSTKADTSKDKKKNKNRPKRLDGPNVAKNTSGSTKSLTVFGNEAITTGRHYWETKLLITPATSYIMIGVADPTTTTLTNFLSHNARGWAIYGTNGNKYHNSANTAYASKLNQGDNVGCLLGTFFKEMAFCFNVILDLDEGIISYYVNGKSKGQAYDKVTGPVRPCVTLYSPNDEVCVDCSCDFPDD